MKRPVIIFGIACILVIAGVLVYRYLPSQSLPPVVSIPSPGTNPLGSIGGYEVSVFARDLEGPRVIVFDPKGRMVISESKKGDIVILEDPAHTGVAQTKKTLMAGLAHPHGMAFFTDAEGKVYFYVAETLQITRYLYDVATASVNIDSKKLVTKLPAGGIHENRTIAFGKNFRDAPIVTGLKINTQNPQKLYISLPSSCDVCLEKDWKYSTILETDPGGNYTAEFAGGLRDVEFFTFHPANGSIWATEIGAMGRGIQSSADEVNVVVVNTKYGWPYCYGNQIQDGAFSEKTDRKDLPMDCSQTVPPLIVLPAHSEPLGIVFIPKTWADFSGQLLIALHGTWNDGKPSGYRVVRYQIDATGKATSMGDFVTGWLSNGVITGQPTDLKFDSLGDLYITDDAAGIIYRVSKSR